MRLLVIGIQPAAGAPAVVAPAAQAQSAVLAWRRREEPPWLRRLAVFTNVVLPIVAFLLYSYL